MVFVFLDEFFKRLSWNNDFVMCCYDTHTSTSKIKVEDHILCQIIVIQAVRVEHCERVHVITAANRICIANCRECVFFLGVNQRPLVVGDNHKLQVSYICL